MLICLKHLNVNKHGWSTLKVYALNLKQSWDDAVKFNHDGQGSSIQGIINKLTDIVEGGQKIRKLEQRELNFTSM